MQNSLLPIAPKAINSVILVTDQTQQIIEAIKLLESTGQFKVLSRLAPRDEFNPEDGSDKLVLMVVDSETTGLDPEKDVIFEIGYVLVEFNPENGKLYKVLDRYSGMEDPGFELSEETTRITGVTDADVKGHVFNRAKITGDISRADYVIAHNSGFDRKFLEPQFPGFKQVPWLCSLSQAPWAELGMGTKKLDYISLVMGNFYYDAHRALVDTEALAEVLTLRGPDGKTVLKHILELGQEPSYTVWAAGSPFETKDVLKANGYRWSDGTEANRPKAWYKDGVTNLDAELSFLGMDIYPRAAQIPVDLIMPVDAFSGRYTERQPIEVKPMARPLQAPSSARLRLG